MQLKSMKKIPIVVGVILLLSFTHLSYGAPQLDLQLAPSLELAQIVYVSDFDFLQQGATQFLFMLTINNIGEPQVFGRLRFEIVRNNDVLAAAETQDFTLPADRSFSASNIEMSNGYIIPGTTTEIKFNQGETTLPSDDFEKEVFESGKLPKGNYRFIVKFRYNNGVSEAAAPTQSLFIFNPTYIQPITPGTVAGNGYLEILYTQFPTFQFESDFDPTNTAEPFHVQIFKKLEQHGSIDEALTSTPHFDEWIHQTVFPYPASAALPLDPGVYLWRVQLELLSTSGTEIVESPVFAFRVDDPSKMGELSDEGVQNDILQILIDSIGDRGRTIAQSLNDFTLKEIRVNGETITKKQFYEVIDSYEGQERIIKEIILMGTQE